MSYLLTEKKNYHSTIEKRRKINEIKNNELNKECFDCGSCYPEYISINNGVFICSNCIKIHNKFPKEISLTLKNDLTTLNDKELQYMYVGGNQKLIEFIHNDFPDLSKFKKEILYQTRAMQYYRDILNYLVNEGPKPIRPSKEINAYEIMDSNTERNNKKYERINLDGNNGIYRTKKRNKSVGNKKGIEAQGMIYSNNIKKIRKNSRNNKSFRKNHFLDDDNVEEELKKHKSFYKEMNKLFKIEDEPEKKGYNYYRNKNNKLNTKLISNDIINIRINDLNLSKLMKYSSKTNESNKNKYLEYPIENIYNNNFYNLSTTKNIFMVTPGKDNIILDYNRINNNNINQIEKLSLTNTRDIYTKPKISSGQINQNNDLLYPVKISKMNTFRINKDSSNKINAYENNYLSTNTYNRRNKKTKETFANININKANNVENVDNNLKRYIRRNELKKEKEKINNHTSRDINNNNKIQIKEIRIENIGGRKRSIDLQNDTSSEVNQNISKVMDILNSKKNENYKRLDNVNINMNNNNKYDKRHYNYKDKEKDNFMNKTQIENREKKIKNINIYFDKNMNKTLFENNNKKKLDNNNRPNPDQFMISGKLEESNGNLYGQKYSIRNKYKMKRKII